MEKILKLMIFFIIIIVIIICMLIILLINKEEGNITDDVTEIDEIDELAERNINWHVETSRNRFYDVKNCVNEFYRCYESINIKNLDIKFNDTEIDYERIERKYAEKIYSMLDKEYVSYKNITIDNVSEKLGKIEKVKVLIDKVYTKDLEYSSYISFVEGRLQENNSNIKSFKMIVRLSGEKTFKILLEDYLKEKNYYNFSEEMDVMQICNMEITNDTYNTYSSSAITAKDYINDLFEHYKETVKNDYEYSYELINEEYKNIRFGSKEEYMICEKENRVAMIGATLSTYSQETVDGTTQYLCQDNYGNYYIFKETAPFQYKVILDNYTIPTEDFIEEYNKVSKSEKVLLNIKRFFMGIDDKNYGYSYNVLSEGFKTNKYPNKQSFIDYAKQNFFEKNEIKHISHKEENGVFIFEIKLLDATGVNQEERTFNIIVKLNNEANFEMSFSRQ